MGGVTSFSRQCKTLILGVLGDTYSVVKLDKHNPYLKCNISSLLCFHYPFLRPLQKYTLSHMEAAILVRVTRN